jgi:hypothetical protein
MKVEPKNTAVNQTKGQLNKMNAQQLRQAADIQDQIEALDTQRAALQGNLDQLMAGQNITLTPATRVTTGGLIPRKFTPESIEKIRRAQKRRWSNVRKVKAAAAAAASTPVTDGAATAPVVSTPAPVVPAPAPVAPAPASKSNATPVAAPLPAAKVPVAA